jgi:hypothetical protein
MWLFLLYGKIFKAIELTSVTQSIKGRLERVKRVLFAAFCILALCSLLLVNVETVNAASASGYVRTDKPTNTTYPNTVDGLWNPDEEWYDAEFTGGFPSSLFACGSTWDFVDDTWVYTRWIIDFFNDTTDDAGDYWEMCIDNNDAGGDSPAASHFRIRIEGHTTLTVYQGNGAGGWDVITPDAGEITWSDSLTTTPWVNDSSHWILEIDILKNGATAFATATWGVRVAVYDESNATQGEVAWPPGSARDVPDEWGTQTYTQTEAYWEVVPEAFTIAVVVLLSSVAVVVSFYLLRKRPKTESYNLKKT